MFFEIAALQRVILFEYLIENLQMNMKNLSSTDCNYFNATLVRKSLNYCRYINKESS